MLESTFSQSELSTPEGEQEDQEEQKDESIYSESEFSSVESLQFQLRNNGKDLPNDTDDTSLIEAKTSLPDENESEDRLQLIDDNKSDENSNDCSYSESETSSESEFSSVESLPLQSRNHGKNLPTVTDSTSVVEAKESFNDESQSEDQLELNDYNYSDHNSDDGFLPDELHQGNALIA